MNFGIIAEYNPFHNGHFYHIAKSKEKIGSENCIVIMSGNFTQRGEPAILNKQIRTKSALLNGASMVIELPVPFATASADIFAFGAVDLLDKANIIDYICFGVETENLSFMENISEILLKEPIEFKSILSVELSKGANYPKARETALSEYLKQNNSEHLLKDLSFLNMPNNILALEYIKTLKALKSKIKPIAVKRKNSDFYSSEIESEIVSAYAIRKAISEFRINNSKNINLIEKIKKAMPENIWEMVFDELKNCPNIEDYMPILDYVLRTKSKKELSDILDVTEGLENRILKFSSEKSIDSFLTMLKTKRYTMSKLRHALLHIVLDIKKTDVFPYLEKGLPYIRVLGFRKDKKELLTELTKKSAVPVITSIKSAEKTLSDKEYLLLKKEIQSSDLYYINTTKERNSEYTKPIVIV